MHHRIEHDDEVLSLFADVTPPADEALMERLCDVGAAELLLPGAGRAAAGAAHGLAPSTIPVLCQRYEASSIAAALQMVHTATIACYLVIAGPARAAGYVGRGPRRVGLPGPMTGPRLVMQYTAASPEAQVYNPARAAGVRGPSDRRGVGAGRNGGACARAPAVCTGRGWAVPCEALAFRRRVFAVFHVGSGSAPASAVQRSSLGRRLFQRPAHDKAHDPPRWNSRCGARLRVPTNTRPLCAHLPRATAAQDHRLSLPKRLGDHGQDCLDRFLGLDITECLGNPLDNGRFLILQHFLSLRMLRLMLVAKQTIGREDCKRVPAQALPCRCRHLAPAMVARCRPQRYARVRRIYPLRSAHLWLPARTGSRRCASCSSRWTLMPRGKQQWRQLARQTALLVWHNAPGISAQS